MVWNFCNCTVSLILLTYFLVILYFASSLWALVLFTLCSLHLFLNEISLGYSGECCLLTVDNLDTVNLTCREEIVSVALFLSDKASESCIWKLSKFWMRKERGKKRNKEKQMRMGR